jgi:hypothetical protein
MMQLRTAGLVAKSPPRNFLVQTMRAETQNIVDDIKQSLGLLRRHL